MGFPGCYLHRKRGKLVKRKQPLPRSLHSCTLISETKPFYVEQRRLSQVGYTRTHHRRVMGGLGAFPRVYRPFTHQQSSRLTHKTPPGRGGSGGISRMLLPSLL